MRGGPQKYDDDNDDDDDDDNNDYDDDDIDVFFKNIFFLVGWQKIG